jgi:tetratricopeptide (TPR) repeat protein
MTKSIQERQIEVAARRQDAHKRLINAYSFILSGRLLAEDLRDAGRPQEALALAEECVTMCRRRFSRRRRYWDTLPRCLETYADVLRTQGHGSAALQAMEEAAATRRKRGLARHGYSAFEFAGCLWDLTDDLRAAGRGDDAVAAAREALAAWEFVAAADSIYCGEVGVSYDKLSGALGEVWRWPEAVTMGREAVAILSLEDPPGSELADSLVQLSTALAALGDDGEAQRVREQADAIIEVAHVVDA